MAKKNTGKVIQMLSPENYIRKKARSLPIFECLVNTGWHENGVAHVIVARNHTNGNITACMYMVDIFCLGIKNTKYLFNVSETDYEERKASMENVDYESISYTLAHNIVFAGLEYAEEYGFKPHKDFASTTQFMLEEDTEEIELIDIECGKDGKPFYICGPYDDQKKINKVLGQLEKTAGPGNYDYILGQDDESEEHDVEDEWREDDQYLDELAKLTDEEKREMFLELTPHIDKLNQKELYRLGYITNMLFNQLTNPELIAQYRDAFLDDMDLELTSKWIPDEMLGITHGTEQISPKTRELFMEIFVDNADIPKQARKLLEKFKRGTPDIPASYYLELQILREEDSPLYPKKLNEYFTKFPDYSLLKLNWLGELFTSEALSEEHLSETYNLQSIFPGRDVLHTLEILGFLMFKLTEIMRKVDADLLEGFCQAYEELDLPSNDLELLEGLAEIVKSQIVQINLKQK